MSRRLRARRFSPLSPSWLSKVVIGRREDARVRTKMIKKLNPSVMEWTKQKNETHKKQVVAAAVAAQAGEEVAAAVAEAASASPRGLLPRSRTRRTTRTRF